MVAGPRSRYAAGGTSQEVQGAEAGDGRGVRQEGMAAARGRVSRRRQSGPGGGILRVGRYAVRGLAWVYLAAAGSGAQEGSGGGVAVSAQAARQVLWAVTGYMLCRLQA